MIKSRIFMTLLLFSLFASGTMGQAALPDSRELLENIKLLLIDNCASCHEGKFPPKSLNLEPGNIDAIVNAPNRELPGLKIVDVLNPESSYLLKKILGDGISGKRMPSKGATLSEAEVESFRIWLHGFREDPDPVPQPQAGTLPAGRTAAQKNRRSQVPTRPFDKPAFWGTRLINLPTSTTMEKGDFLFRVSHRFIPKLNSGYDSFYGLDGPAVVFISMGYGMSDKLGITVGRSNLFQEWEFSADWLVVEQGKRRSRPLSAALRTGLGWVTQKREGRSRFDAKNFKINLQLSLSRQLTRRWSLMAVPSFSTNTNHWEMNPKGTFALGFGTRYMIFEDLSALVEWIPVIAGHKNIQNGWGLGIEKKIGGHVFQVFLENSMGMATDQFITGGDLRLQDFDFRIGFNLFRTF